MVPVQLYSTSITSVGLMGNGNFNVIRSRMKDAWRHEGDADLDPTIRPIIYQRRYGLQGYELDNNHKPDLVKAGSDIMMAIGNHTIYGDARISPVSMQGVHWTCADPTILRARFVARRNRMSPINKQNQWGVHQQSWNEDNYLERAKEHLLDEQIL